MGCPSGLLGFSPASLAAVRDCGWGEKGDAAAPEGHPIPPSPADVEAEELGDLGDELADGVGAAAR